MVCACGHSFAKRSSHRGPLPGDLGCFVWMFLLYSAVAFLLAWFCSGFPYEKDSMQRFLPYAQFLLGLPGLIVAWGLTRRKLWAFYLGAIVVTASIPVLPHGLIIMLIVVSGLSKQRQFLE
jgi:hypothetical protein